MELPETFGSEVFRFLTMPAFGAQSKREIELKVFELVYRERLLSGPALLTSQISAELRVTRARARQLLLETRLRLEAENHENREQVLRRVVSSWVDQPLEYDGERFSVVVGDPWVREAIKGHAADNGVPLDGSFNSDIVKFSWPGYVRLLSSLYQELDEQDARGIFGAEIRKRVLSDEKLKDEFAKELETLLAEDASADSIAQRAATVLRQHPRALLTLVQTLAAAYKLADGATQ